MSRAGVDLFSEVKTRVSITDILSLYSIQTRRNKAICPFHREDTPSFRIYPDNNSFYCYGCGVGGSVIDFVARYHGIKPLEAAKKIDYDFRLGLADGSMSEEQRREYAAKRAEREHDNKLVIGFKEWEETYFKYLCDNLHLLEQLQETSRPERMGGRVTDDYAAAHARKQLVEYHLGILNNGELDEKISLYRHKHGAVT